jgi:proline iminopeptidase
MTSVAANGITIEYESLGDPAAPPILLIMGLGMQLIAWPDAFCQGLLDRGFRVIRFDNRDCGLSSKIQVRRQPNLVAALAAAWLRLRVRSPYTLDDMAADAVALLDALAIPRAHIVGLSMGGMIAQLVAARYPDRALSLTSIMSSSGRRKVSQPRPEAKRALLSKPANPGDPDSVVEHLIGVFGVIGSPGFPTERSALREQVARSVRRGNYPAGVTRQLVAIIASGDRRRMLRKITAPTLVIHGAADPLVPVEAGRDTARHITGAKLEVIEGMGHDMAPGLQPILVESIAAHCRESEARFRARDAPARWIEPSPDPAAK